MTTTQPVTDWKKEWFDIEDAVYLNTANHAAMPCVSLRAVQASLEANKFPRHVDNSAFFEAPMRLRASIARLIGSKPEQIALTTRGSPGVAALAHGLTWTPGDEIITDERKCSRCSTPPRSQWKNARA